MRRVLVLTKNSVRSLNSSIHYYAKRLLRKKCFKAIFGLICFPHMLVLSILCSLCPTCGALSPLGRFFYFYCLFITSVGKPTSSGKHDSSHKIHQQYFGGNSVFRHKSSKSNNCIKNEINLLLKPGYLHSMVW